MATVIDVLEVMDEVPELYTACASNHGDPRLEGCSKRIREARAAVAELIEAGNAAHMALIGYLPEHRNAVTSCAIARIEAALARCGAGS